MARWLIMLLLVASQAVLAGTPTVSALQKTPYHADEKIERDIGYSAAVRVGDTLYISGVVGAGPMAKAIPGAYGALKKILAAHGLDFRHVVKENVYATDLDAFIQNKELRRTFYGNDFPAATWVGVQRLFVPELTVEVELIAVFPK